MSRIEEITRYRTTDDGAMFASMTEAERHADDLLCEAIDTFLTKYAVNAHVRSVNQMRELLTESPTQARLHLRRILELLPEDK